jgi:ribosomal protein S18 acetylase RimI-like enzyme
MTREALAQKHVRFGWWALLVFLSLGLLLETFHGFKIGYYLDVDNEARRLAFRLGHAHGTLLSLVHVAFGLTLASRFAPSERSAARASPLLVAATLLLPGGFLVGGLFLQGGEPGVGVFLVPVGAIVLLLAVLAIARGLPRGAPTSAPAAIELREVSHGSPEYEDGILLRERVLRNPLGIEMPPNLRAEEVNLQHLGAFEGERLVGYLVLHDQGNGVVRMRQVAVDFDRQRRGIGKALVTRSEGLARSSGYTTMTLHARETAVAFYQALGYEIFDEPFVEVTVPHRKMRKPLGVE